MHLLIICIASIISVWGLYRSLYLNNDEELIQAGLLPFADDPDAAKRVEAKTGLHCDHVFNPVAEAELEQGDVFDA